MTDQPFRKRGRSRRLAAHADVERAQTAGEQPGIEGAKRVAELPDVQSRQMFGYPAAFTNAQMFASLFQDQMIVRLSSADREALVRDGARQFEPMPGRPMREYVVVPDPVRGSPAAMREWLFKARAYASSLPPKKTR